MKTLGVKKLKGGEAERYRSAHNVFLRLFADYLLQQGAPHDAARFFVASWVNAGGEGLTVDTGAFDSVMSLQRDESAFAEGAWPVAHELGHALSGDPSNVLPTLSRLASDYIGGAGDRIEAPSDNDRAQLLEEVLADYYGAELVIRLFGGGRVNLPVVLGEFESNMWCLLLTEECKELARSISTDQNNAVILLRDFEFRRAWIYHCRMALLMTGVRADFLQGVESETEIRQYDRTAKVISDHTRAVYIPLLTGFYQTCKTIVEWPLLRQLDADGGRYMDQHLQARAIALSQFSVPFKVEAREFVDRAKITNNLLGQSTEFIEILDTFVPRDAMPFERRPLAADEINTVPLEYGEGE